MKWIRQSAIVIGCLGLSLMQAPIYADTMDQLNQQEAQLQQRSEQNYKD